VKLEGNCKHTAAMHSRNLDHLDRMANEINTSIFVKTAPVWRAWVLVAKAGPA
jgi:aldehyde dehydrogenase